MMNTTKEDKEKQLFEIRKGFRKILKMSIQNNLDNQNDPKIVKDYDFVICSDE